MNRKSKLGMVGAALLAAMLVAPHAGAQNAIERKGGSCPTGYNQSGDYCVGSSSSAKHAMHRSGGSCPSGYSQSGSYCVKN